MGCQRQRGRVNENPTATQFYKSTQALWVVNSFCMPSVRGNSRGNKSHNIDFEAENPYQSDTEPSSIHSSCILIKNVFHTLKVEQSTELITTTEKTTP